MTEYLTACKRARDIRDEIRDLTSHMFCVGPYLAKCIQGQIDKKRAELDECKRKIAEAKEVAQ